VAVEALAVEDAPMRICIWHGWLLDGTGSNVATARIAEELRAAGHDVLIVCQEPHPERTGFIDAAGTVDAEGVSALTPVGEPPPATGRAVVLRPRIGSMLPVFVLDEYEGWSSVKRFVDLSDAELEAYLDVNAKALRVATRWHRSDAVVAGHAVPGPVIARRALGAGNYAAKVHGSDLEYAVRRQRRYRDLAREALEGATVVIGASADVLRRTVAVAPAIADRCVVITPGVDAKRFRRRSRSEALSEVAVLLDADPSTARGRAEGMNERVETALEARDAGELTSLAGAYDQRVPDPGAAARLRALAQSRAPIAGYLGKLIAPKGVERMIEALAVTPPPVRGLVVGFGGDREWLTALTHSLGRGDAPAHAWIGGASDLHLELTAAEVAAATGLEERVDFTGILDHRYAPNALAALDVVVAPSTLTEAFGIVVAEAAATGALPLVARHSGLAEVAGALEAEIDRPGWLSFEPGHGATRRLADGVRRLLAIPSPEREDLRSALSAFVAREWTWSRAAERFAAALVR
jgi:glycosyltransferase involved in cell wall biosynthesis